MIIVVIIIPYDDDIIKLLLFMITISFFLCEPSGLSCDDELLIYCRLLPPLLLRDDARRW